MQTGRRVRVLPEETANRVAAGEVVERPAAALKELLENSLDAGASRIGVDLSRAGQGLIRVGDDGCGLSPDDLLLSLERHATSKIVAVADLARVATYGFRGEALPSISAVSRLRIETRPREAREGTRLDAEFGRILRVAPCGCPEGTTIEVRDLFQALPARLKFLRSEATELGQCVQVATRLALACPGVGFLVRHNEREILRLPAATDAGARLREHLGREFFAGFVPLRGAGESCAVSGHVSRPGAGRPGLEYQQLFVNGRPVRDAFLAQGVREASRDHFLHQQHGISYFLWLTLPADLVDVNVHPTKREVRFREPAAVLNVVAGAVREALRRDRAAVVPVSVPGVSRPTIAPSRYAGQPAVSTDSPSSPSTWPLAAPHPLAAEQSTLPSYAVSSERQPALPLRSDTAAAASPPPALAPGQLFGTYLVCPGPDGLVLVDQHAAHERILYERFLSRPAGSGCQQLLTPILFAVAPAEETTLESLLATLGAIGVVAEPIGPRSWRITALPVELEAGAAVGFVRELLARALDGEAPAALEDFRHRAAALLACHTAIRANQRLESSQIAALLSDLSRSGNPGACPHGRPTSIVIDRDEIERRFKRT